MMTTTGSAGTGGRREQVACRKQLAMLVAAALVAALLGFGGPGTAAAQTDDDAVTYSGIVKVPDGASAANLVVTVFVLCGEECPDDAAGRPDDGPRLPLLVENQVFLGEASVDSSGRWSVTISETESEIKEYPKILVVWDRDGNLVAQQIFPWDHPELWGWESLSDIDVELEAGGRVSGRFNSPSGGPLPDTDFVLVSPLGGMYVLDVDPETGEFTSPAVAPGEYSLGWTFPPGGDLLPNTSAARVEVAAGRTTNAGTIDATPAAHGAVTGRVTDDNGRGLAGIQVTGRLLNPLDVNPSWTVPRDLSHEFGDFEFSAITDADGTYETPARLMPGDWEIAFSDPTGEYATSHPKGTAIATGYEHSCAIKTDQTIACWGDNRAGQTDAPPGAYTAIAAGDNHSCAIRTDQTIACWGYNGDGQTDAPPGAYTAITIGKHYSCAVKTDGIIACWGDTTDGHTDAYSGTYMLDGTYSAIATGGLHSCALATDGAIACWGDTTDGQLDAPAGAYTAIAPGYNHSCALRTDQTIACWSHHGDGQLDAPAGAYTAIATGGLNSCALATDQTIACWLIRDGRFGNTDDRYGVNDAPAGTYTAIAPGFNHWCALKTDGTIACWGDNATGDNVYRFGITDDVPAGAYTAITAGFGYSCALKTDGTIACWGDNRAGQTDAPAGTYTAIATVFSSISGSNYSCALKTDQTITCWGAALWNDLEIEVLADAPSDHDGFFTDIAIDTGLSCRFGLAIACWGDDAEGFNITTDVPAGTYTAIAQGGSNWCALATDQTIACWGLNLSGVNDAPPGAYTAIAQGGSNWCALATDQTIACWGYFRELGPGPSDTYVLDGTAIAIATGWEHSCAIRTNGTIACWGDNIGNIFDRADAPDGIYPDIFALADAPDGIYTAIAAGYDHSCAIRTNGTIACWGDNHYGQTDAPPGAYTSIAAGDNHSCAIKTDQTIACWGDNRAGQTDAPAGAYTSIAAGDNHSCAIKTDQTIACWGYHLLGSLNPVGVVVMSGETAPLDVGLVSAFASDGDTGAGVAARCFASHQFGAEPVDVAKSADGQTVLAQVSWGYHDAIGCYLTLDEAALGVLRASPAPPGFPAGDAEAAQRCFEAHQFGAELVDVAKSADGQTVLAQVSWGYHNAIGCYLTLDPAATTTLRAAHT